MVAAVAGAASNSSTESSSNLESLTNCPHQLVSKKWCYVYACVVARPTFFMGRVWKCWETWVSPDALAQPQMCLLKLHHRWCTMTCLSEWAQQHHRIPRGCVNSPWQCNHPMRVSLQGLVHSWRLQGWEHASSRGLQGGGYHTQWCHGRGVFPVWGVCRVFPARTYCRGENCMHLLNGFTYLCLRKHAQRRIVQCWEHPHGAGFNPNILYTVVDIRYLWQCSNDESPLSHIYCLVPQYS